VNAHLLGSLACLLVLPWSAPTAQCSRETVTGDVTYVRDGDTIELGEMA
jgi:endonuclease YncB( thermonuclease family)